MKNQTDIRRGRHCVFLMHVHLVFVTKYRRKIFDQDAIEKLRGYFSSVCADFDVELVEMDGERDHVHLLITRQNCQYLIWLTVSKGYRVDYFDEIVLILRSIITTKGFFGFRVISQGVVVAHQYPLSASTLSNRKHLVSLKTAPYIPSLKDGDIRRIG